MRYAVFKAVATLLVAAVVASTPARAADPIFPRNSHIGMTPPPGFVPATRFPGFEYPEGNAAIMVLDLPPQAFAEIEKGFTDEALKSRGMMVESRTPVELKDGRGFMITGDQITGNVKKREIVLAAALPGVSTLVSVQIGEQARGNLPDAVVHEALKTVVARAQIPDEEKLSVLPYKLNDLAGFRIVRGGSDGSALLTDGPEDAVDAVAQPFVVIGLMPTETPRADDRPAFARRVFASVPGLKDVRFLRAEPLRISGEPGFEILAEAKDLRSNTEVTTVQWLRFGPNGYLQIFAIARREKWDELFPRLRAVRDGVQLR
jgi:hypothetical protein